MSRLPLPATVASLVSLVSLVFLGACAERAERPDEAADAEAAEPAAVPGQDAVLVEEGEGLLERVRISDGEARVVALMKVSGGRIVRATLEEKDRRLAYAYDMVVEAKPGIVVEVVVDALTGAVVSVTEETEPK